jgi:hypothetical protein
MSPIFHMRKNTIAIVNSRSWEVLLESIGQFGPRYRGPSYHDVREAWKEYGCSIMSDAWIDTRHQHLINFLANSPAGTFFLASVDASSEVASVELLEDLLEKAN